MIPGEPGSGEKTTNDKGLRSSWGLCPDSREAEAGQPVLSGSSGTFRKKAAERAEKKGMGIHHNPCGSNEGGIRGGDAELPDVSKAEDRSQANPGV